MAKNIELFYFPGSFYSQKVRMYFNEKGVTPKLHHVDLQKGDNLKDDFLRMNPEGKIPVIRIGDTAIPDSDEIFKYGEDNIPGVALVPSYIADRVWKLHEAIHALNIPVVTFGCLMNPKYSEDLKFPRIFISMARKRMGKGTQIEILEARLTSAPKDLVPVISAKIENFKVFMKKIQDEDTVNSALQEVDQLLGKCEAQLEGSSGPYLFGETFTISDIDLAILLIRLSMLGLDKRFFPADGARKNLLRFLQAMEQRESYQLIMKEVRQLFTSAARAAVPYIIGAVVAIGIAVGIGFLMRRRH